MATEKTQKTMAELLGEYAAGWAGGNTPQILGACAPDYEFRGDPAGVVSRDEFAAYHATFVAEHGATMEITEVVVEEGDQLKVRCRWKAADGLEGTGFIVVGPEGVEHEEVVLL